LLKYHSNNIDIKLIHSTNFVGWSGEQVWKDCADFEISIVLIETNFDKIIGFYSPLKWENRGEFKLQNGKAFVFYFDDKTIKICN